MVGGGGRGRLGILIISLLDLVFDSLTSALSIYIIINSRWMGALCQVSVSGIQCEVTGGGWGGHVVRRSSICPAKMSARGSGLPSHPVGGVFMVMWGGGVSN